MTTAILQLCPLLPDLETALQHRFTVHRWFEIEQRQEWLGAHAGAIRGVVTGGHLGIPNALADQLPTLEIVAINGVGFDKVDLAYAKARGLSVTNTPDVLTNDVADLAIGLTITLLRRIAEGDHFVRAGRWPGGDLGLGRTMTGRRFGIFGLGRIGKAIARRLEGFEGTIAYVDAFEQPVPYRRHAGLLELAAASEILIIAAAAGPATASSVGREALDALGPDGVLVNVARGTIVDELELVQALVGGRIAGAALDVFADEPNVPEALRTLPSVVLTPHMASATIDTRRAMAELVLANLDAHFTGQPLPTAVG